MWSLAHPGYPRVEPTLEEMANLYLDSLILRKGLMKSTVFHYGHDLELFKRFLERKYETRADELAAAVVGPANIQEFLNYQSEKRNNRPASIRRRMSCLRGFFFFLQEHRIVPGHLDCDLYNEPDDKRLPKVLTHLEATSLLKAALTVGPNPPRDFAIMSLFLTSGPTLSELLNLTVDDIDFDNGTVRYGSRYERVIPLPPDTLRTCRKYIDMRPDTYHRTLFLGRSNEPLTDGGIYYAFDRCRAEANLHDRGITINTLRNTFIFGLVASDRYTRREILDLTGLRSETSLNPYYVLLRQMRRRRKQDLE